MNLNALANKNLLDPEIVDNEVLLLFEDCYQGLRRLATKQNIEFPGELVWWRDYVHSINEKS